MPHHSLQVVLGDFEASLKRARLLAAAAQQWTSSSSGISKPRFTSSHQEMLIELSLFKSYLAWEGFIEDTFILYLMGKKTSRSYAPKCFALLPTRKHAIQFTIPDGRQYADWDSPMTVLERASKFFDNGEPYKTALGTHINLLQNFQTLRNASAHRSNSSQEKFKRLVRNELKTFPPKCTVGSFLAMNKPGTHNKPISYLDYYLDMIAKMSRQIVRV